MRFKTPLCIVLCLVITVMLHSVTAQVDSLSIEALVDFKIEKFELKLMKKLQAQNQEVIDKQAASFENLERLINNIIVGQLELQNKVSNKMKEHSRGQEKLIEKLDAHATNMQQMSKSIENIQNITENLASNQSVVRKHLTIVMNDLRHLKSHAKKDKSHEHNDVIDKDDLFASKYPDGNQFPDVTTESIERGNQSNSDVIPTSCATLNNNATGSYSIRPEGAVEPFLVRCDFEDNYGLGGGWTVFQHRYDGSVDFYRNWKMYKNGFGDVNAEHWLGLEKLHAMTKSGKHELLIIMEDFVDGHSYAHYNDFKIGSEDEKYKLTVGNYSGTAGDSLEWHNGMKFSTFDQQNDAHVTIDCAEKYRGAWWYNDCFDSTLNGEYLRRGKHITDERQGVKWNHWKGAYYSLKSTKMMLRRR